MNPRPFCPTCGAYRCACNLTLTTNEAPVRIVTIAGTGATVAPLMITERMAEVLYRDAQRQAVADAILDSAPPDLSEYLPRHLNRAQRRAHKRSPR